MNTIDDFLESMLEDQSLEEILEQNGITPLEVLLFLYLGGQVLLSDYEPSPEEYDLQDEDSD